MTTESEFVSSETTTTVYNKKANQLRDHSEMYEINRCLGLLDEVFCINGGKCINYTMRDVPTVLFLSCECADGFMGERCESKYLEGTYKRK